MDKIKEKLIYTNDNCVGCNKCISVCSCPGATVASESSERTNVINIDSTRCITCGACFDACEHDAREYVDDTSDFFTALEKQDDISVLIAPAFFINYQEEHKAILGKLKALGVNRILNVSFGADITTWGYLNYIKEHNFKGGISQPCPSVVDYIEKYVPELIPKLIPIQSPMMCAAIYARKYLGISGKLAFIGPCIAKKKEITSKRGNGIISYNVTFKHMVQHLKKLDVAPLPYDVETNPGLGSVYPMIGGLAQNISHFLGKDAFIRSVSGEREMCVFFEKNKERILSDDCPYFMIDALNCSDGCLCGTGVEGNISKEETLIRMMQLKTKISESGSDIWSEMDTPDKRLAALNKQFEMLDIKDYLCSYDDKSAESIWKLPTEEELELIFNNMNKTTAASRKINCSSCGYNSCKDMAVAIYNGYNHRENCIHFIKDMLQEITMECPTVLVINEKNRSIDVVKYTGEAAIKSWINSSLRTYDYNSAIKSYIKKYVDEADQARLWAEVEFSALERNLSQNNHFSILYMRHSETGDSGYFQLEFTRLEGRDIIVLNFRDVDEMIRDDIKKRDELQNALNRVNHEGRIIQSLTNIYYIIYVVDLCTYQFEELKSPPEVSEFINQFTDARECLDRLPEIMFEAENLEEIKAFYKADTWSDRLSHNGFCSIEVRGRIRGWIRTILISVEKDQEGRTIKALCAIQNVNSEKEQSLKNYAIISGLSVEYSSLWLINVKDKKIRLERSNHVAALVGLDKEQQETWQDYDFTMNHYIDSSVYESDKERIRHLVELETLMSNIPENDLYTINFLKESEGVQKYHQMVFSHAKDIEGRKNIVLAFRDVDALVRKEQKKQKQLEDALLAAEQANRAKSTFLANMSHEIRTPINAILGMDTMILRESKEENVLDYAKNVKSASETLLSLINDILDFSKIESGKMEIVTDKYRLDSALNDLMNMVSNKTKDKGLELVLEIMPQIPVQLYGDEIRIKQIILNLLNNAIKYTKTGRIIFSVGYEAVTDHDMLLCISVCDTGIGIKKEDMDKLFSPYDRLDEHVNKYVEGTGLGLAITRSLLDRMGSKLEVDSVYGVGSTFSCKIKQELWGKERMSQENVVLDTNFEEEADMTYQAPTAKILVVDDVAMNIQVMTNLMKRTQIVPDCCLSGKEAVKLAAEKKYDIIFLDAMMPEMSGEDTLYVIRETCTINADTPIIVLTANAIVGAKENYMEEGFTDYISKPVDGIKLEKLIQRYLPTNKVMEIAKDVVEEEPLSSENVVILEGIKKLQLLSVDKGIEASGDRGTYIDVCRSFVDTAADRIKMISDFWENSDISNYTIQVHALKSSARFIGAETLSESALAMEMAGKNNELEKIALSTPALIENYRMVAKVLGDVFYNQEESQNNKKELTPKQFRRRMMELMELIEAYDFKTACDLMNSMIEFKLTDNEKALISVLRPLMADVKQEEVITAISNYLEEVQ